MSADTTIVIAVHKPLGEWRYSAAVVQDAEDLFGDDQTFALEKAHRVFFKAGTPWFSSLGLAKQFAFLLAQNLRAVGGLEYENRLTIEIGEARVYRLSRRGNRLDGGVTRKKGTARHEPPHDAPFDPSNLFRYLGPDDYSDEISGRITNG